MRSPPTESRFHKEVAIDVRSTPIAHRGESTQGWAPGMSVSELRTYSAQIRAQIDAGSLEPAYGWLEFVAKLDARATELERVDVRYRES